MIIYVALIYNRLHTAYGLRLLVLPPIYPQVFPCMQVMSCISLDGDDPIVAMPSLLFPELLETLARNKIDLEIADVTLSETCWNMEDGGAPIQIYKPEAWMLKAPPRALRKHHGSFNLRMG